MRHQKQGRKFGRDTNARKSMFIVMSKNLIEKEQIKTTLPKAKDLRGVVEKLVTRAKVDTVANRRLVAAELGNNNNEAVVKLFTVLGPRYKDRPGGYVRVLKAGFRYGDAAPMAIIEFVDRDVDAKKAKVAPVAEKADKAEKATKPAAEKAEKAAKAPAKKATKPAAEKAEKTVKPAAKKAKAE